MTARWTLPRWIREADKRSARRVNTRRLHPRIGGTLTRLSHLADHGVLWFVIAAALIGLGGRYRRAGLRGAASLGVASALANLVGKRLVGGPRPLLRDVPLARQLRKTPTSPSFPSGHTASAAAFAVGVALEAPRAGAAVLPLAAAVGYSRLHTGAHWLSDVLGGALLGATVAAVGRAIVPARTTGTTGSVSGREDSRVQLQTDGRGGGLLIIVNPHSGQDAHRPSPVPLLARRLPGARIHVLREGDEIATVVADAAAGEQAPGALGVYGGDGTVAAVAQTARQHHLPLLVLPGGTFNHFAQSAGVTSVDAAVDAFLAGSTTRCDIGELAFQTGEPITVLNTASIGVYPLYVEVRQKYERRLGKRIASVIAAAHVVRTADPIELTIGGRTERIWSIFVGINRYHPAAAAPLQRSRLDDGVLDVRILHARSKPRSKGFFVLATGHRLASMLDRLSFASAAPVIQVFTTTRLDVAVAARSHADPGFAHDGEASPVTPGGAADDGTFDSSVRIVPGGLIVFTPDPDPER